jgi:hypothetical protein
MDSAEVLAATGCATPQVRRGGLPENVALSVEDLTRSTEMQQAHAASPRL